MPLTWLTVAVVGPKPVASIATLADYLVNGFWQYNSTLAHHFASNTVSYNINGLNSAEQVSRADGVAGVVTRSPTSPLSRPPAPRTSPSPTTAPMQAYTTRQLVQQRCDRLSDDRTSAPTGSPPTAAPTTARPASTATATRPTFTKSDTRSVSAIRGRITAARRIRPTRSMPTTPGNIPSCRISRSPIIPEAHTAMW